MSYYRPSWRALQIKCAWRWRMLDQSLLIGPRWQLSRALRSREEGIPGVGITEGGMEEWAEGVENNLWAERLEMENDSNSRGRSRFLNRQKYGEKMLETLKIWWGLVPVAWGRLVQPAHGWRALLRSAWWLWVVGFSTGPTISNHREDRRICREASWEIREWQKEHTDTGLKSH